MSSASPPTPPSHNSLARELDEAGDALRRTRLAAERTYLAWWRTGLTALAVGIGAGSIAPKLVGGERWAYVGVGIGFTLVGVALLAYALRRQVVVDRAISAGRFAPPDPRMLLVLTAAGVILAILTIVLLITSL